MCRHKPIGQAFVFSTALWILVMGSISVAVGGEDETEDEPKILKITVGKPTTLSSVEVGNTANLSVSRTGVVAAFYPRKGPQGDSHFYRTSADGGLTWSKERPAPFGGGADGTPLREGGVIRAQDGSFKIFPDWPWTTRMFRFNDDFSEYVVEMETIHCPEAAVMHREIGAAPPHGLGFSKGKMVQLPNGDILAPVSGRLKGDLKGRGIVLRSSDLGRTWYYQGSMPPDVEDPNPEFPGEYLGYCEVSIALLSNGQMLSMLRTQYSHEPPDYKPMYVSWSDDQGKTWSKPVPTEPHLMNINPTLAVLNNGVVACVYGRPGFHVAFSTDNGRTWNKRISFTDLPAGQHTGQEDMVKMGPNKLMAIGSVPGGTKAFPITVELVKNPSPNPFELAGRVLDEGGNPVANAKVELGPNRYTTEYKPIYTDHGYPTTTTDAQGRFQFRSAEHGGAVLTVEADDYVPSWQHVWAKHGMEEMQFKLKAGQIIEGSVVDEAGKPLAGACLQGSEIPITIRGNLITDENWHVHTDLSGQFRWLVEGEPPAQADVRLVKFGYTQLKQKMTPLEMQRPIVMCKLPFPKEGPTLSGVRVYEDPPIEAGFDDEVWSRSPVASRFWVSSKSGGREIPVEAKFAYDESYLYVIARVGSGGQFEAADEETLELVIDPGKDWYHLGPFQFSYSPKGRIPGAFGWNCPWPSTHTSRNSDGSWTVSTAISWQVVDMSRPKAGTEIGFGLAHVQAMEGAKTSESLSAQIGPPAVFRYGRLVLE